MFAVPVSADPPMSTHVSNSDCYLIEETGFTYCSQSETVTRTTEGKDGATKIKVDEWFLSKAMDPSGAVVSSFELNSSEHDTVVVEGGAVAFVDQNVSRADKITEGGVTTCTRYRLVVKNGEERVNEATTRRGARRRAPIVESPVPPDLAGHAWGPQHLPVRCAAAPRYVSSVRISFDRPLGRDVASAHAPDRRERRISLPHGRSIPSLRAPEPDPPLQHRSEDRQIA
jgi:hypothetical protein